MKRLGGLLAFAGVVVPGVTTESRSFTVMRRRTRRSTLIGVALALCALIPAAGWSQQIIEPHMPGWEQFFKIEWEPGEWRGHPVVKGYLYNASPKTIGEVHAPLVDIAPQQPASYRVSVYSYSEILAPRGRGRGF